MLIVSFPLDLIVCSFALIQPNSLPARHLISRAIENSTCIQSKDNGVFQFSFDTEARVHQKQGLRADAKLPY